MDEEEVNKLNDLNKDIIEQENEVQLDGDDVLPDVADPNTVMEEVTVMTAIGCAWKYLLSLLEACTMVITSFSIELTALTASLAKQRYIINSSLGLCTVTIGSSAMHCFISWNAFSASGIH
ncbi:hypothetical protein Tco_0917175 [Tanacetum coccineum]